MDPDEIKFLGIWCALLVLATFPSVTVKHFTLTNKKDIENLAQFEKNEKERVSETETELDKD